MWLRVLGADLSPGLLGMSAWERFIDRRSSGAIDARGRAVPAARRRPVGPRTVEADCLWLRWVFNWATRWRLDSGRFLMSENPIRGYETPRERNPRRPTATHDRYEAVRGVSDQIETELRWDGRVRRRSYLSELLDIVNGTGRRTRANADRSRWTGR